jgi:hypothetical protein
VYEKNVISFNKYFWEFFLLATQNRCCKVGKKFTMENKQRWEEERVWEM